jgi:hypothetical protein
VTQTAGVHARLGWISTAHCQVRRALGMQPIPGRRERRSSQPSDSATAREPRTGRHQDVESTSMFIDWPHHGGQCRRFSAPGSENPIAPVNSAMQLRLGVEPQPSRQEQFEHPEMNRMDRDRTIMIPETRSRGQDHEVAPRAGTVGTDCGGGVF